jgi:predicted component of type VI protein secretion system
MNKELANSIEKDIIEMIELRKIKIYTSDELKRLTDLRSNIIKKLLEHYEPRCKDTQTI